MGETRVSSVSSVKNLGSWFDSNMNLYVNINNTCKAAYYHLTNVRRIRNGATQSLVHALIIGRIDYCNSMLCGLPAKHIAKLQRVHNSAARLVFNIPRYSHITPVLISLHWLPVKFRIYFIVILITFKVLHGIAPDYLRSLINVKENRIYNLRGSKGLALIPPKKTLKTLGDRAFSAAAPRMWNALPLEIRNERNFARFKTLLKTHLFKLAFTLT